MSEQLTTFREAGDVPDRLRPALVDLIYRLADDALVIGHRHSEWTGIGPILEEDIAFSSMAQDKIGHAVVLYGMLHELGEPTPDELAYARQARDFRCCEFVSLDAVGLSRAPGGAGADGGDAECSAPSLSNNPVRDRLVSKGDWARSCVQQFLFSEADALRMGALEHSAYEPLAALARKLRGEIKYHTMHGRLLIDKFGTATTESRSRAQAALDELYPYALGMFETTEADVDIVEAGFGPAESDIGAQWARMVHPLLAAAGLSMPKSAAAVSGGRMGKHSDELGGLLADLRRVYQLDPTASW